MILRGETPGDEAGIRAVHLASFSTPAEADLVDALRAAGRLTVSRLAADRGEIVGHVALSPVRLAGSDAGVGLAPVAVLPAFRRRGIGDRLIREGLARCAAAGWAFAVVLGEPAYYGRFGFRPASRLGLRDEYGGGDAFQALELRPGSIPAAGGLVRYAPEFAGVGGESGA
jgi:putative acetyltransferase